KRLVKTNDYEAAAKCIDKGSRRFYTSAAQSAVFNGVVARRVQGQTLATVLTGDVATKHNTDLLTGGSFVVEDAMAEQPRCDAWEISPAGPMPGKKMHPRATEEAETIERAVFDELGVRPGVFDSLTGTRRPIRVRPTDTKLAGGVDEHGGYITVAFTLPAGSYATTLLREIMKPEP
ncbi:MAG: tRNA pseudouridine(13) synthase TruD, partial [Planctomycetota bacterium]